MVAPCTEMKHNKITAILNMIMNNIFWAQC
jgi:hypothetical protein